MVKKYARSKAGWRKKPTTAIRQEKQLKHILGEVAERCGEESPSKILWLNLDTMEEVLLRRLSDHPAQVKSLVIAQLEFSRFVSVREPHESAAWDAAMRRLEVWKRHASLMNHNREAELQDRMSEDDYLPSKEELTRLRAKVHEKLSELSKKDVERRTDAVKIKRRVDAAQSVKKNIKAIMYGGDEGEVPGSSADLAQDYDQEITVPSSAGALDRRQWGVQQRFSATEQVVIDREARRLWRINTALATHHVLAIMSEDKPLFDERSPRATDQLKRALSQLPNRCSTELDFPGRSESRRLRSAK